MKLTQSQWIQNCENYMCSEYGDEVANSVRPCLDALRQGYTIKELEALLKTQKDVSGMQIGNTTMKYPLLVVQSVDEGTHFKLMLNDKFPDVHFIVKKSSKTWLGVFVLDDVGDELYNEIYQYAQKLFADTDWK